MSANTSRKLAQQIWSIANDLRGNMDASKFKDYILGVIFYRYLSTHTEQYMNDVLKNDDITYREALSSPDIDPEFAKEVRDWALENLGYVIEPDMLFDSLVEQIRNKTFTIETFERAVTQLTGSTVGRKSEVAFSNLFDAMDLRDSDLGKEVSDRTDLISKVILKIHDTPFASASEAGDVLGAAYMYLIGLFQSNAGKKGGEFFTPTPVSPSSPPSGSRRWATSATAARAPARFCWRSRGTYATARSPTTTRRRRTAPRSTCCA